MGLSGLEVKAQTRQPNISQEYAVKAAFLYNFTMFVEWPEGHDAAEGSPIVIGLLGRDPFKGHLHALVRDRQVGKRGFRVETFDSAEDVSGVHLLFVPAGEEFRLRSKVSRLHPKGILTVGETEDFYALDGIITFTLENNRIRFYINRQAAEPTGVKFNAQLLQLALSSP